MADWGAGRHRMDVDLRDEELYGKHANELIRLATTLVGPARAEDVVANAVVRAMTSHGWAEVVEPRAYLFRAVVNEARMLHRSEWRRRRRESFAAGAESTVSDGISLEVRDAMSRLTLRERSVLYLAYWHEMSVDEIARSLGISRRTAERALTGARRSLEEQLT